MSWTGVRTTPARQRASCSATRVHPHKARATPHLGGRHERPPMPRPRPDGQSRFRSRAARRRTSATDFGGMVVVRRCPSGRSSTTTPSSETNSTRLFDLSSTESDFPAAMASPKTRHVFGESAPRASSSQARTTAARLYARRRYGVKLGSKYSMERFGVVSVDCGFGGNDERETIEQPRREY